MEIRNKVNALLICFTFCALLVPIQASAEDNIERSCKAMYGLYIPETVNSKGAPMRRIEGHMLLDKKYEFSARRGCGSIVPNRCRQRASEAAKQCMIAHAKAPATMPAACTSNGVKDYPIMNLEQTVKEAACSYARDFFGSNLAGMDDPFFVKTSIKAIIDGDKGCGGGDNKNLMEYVRTLTVTCTKQD